MMGISESGAAGGLVCAAAALLSIVLTRVAWLRVHELRDSLSAGGLALRLVLGGLLTSLSVVAGMAAVSLLPPVIALPESWAWLTRAESIAGVCLVISICLVDAEIGRRWLVLGAGIAAAGGWAGTSWLENFALAAPLTEPGAAFAAGTLSALLISPGPNARLLARLRRTSSGADGIHVLLVDAQGRIAQASRSARAALGLSARPTSLRRSREPLPKSLQDVVLAGARPEPAKLRTPSGLILETSVVDLGRFGRARGTRALLLRDVTSEHRSKKRLVALAHHDSLTGLANRRLFLERLKRIVEAEDSVADPTALYYIDLDGFKAINDSLGHAAGDALLSELAKRFREQLGGEQVARFGVRPDASAIVARLAGDEFAVIAPGIANGDAAARLALFISEIIASPLELSGRILNPSACIGIALFPAHGRNVEQLLQRADAALYLAKSRGRQRYVLYEAAMDEKADREQLVEEGLRTALQRHEMCLHYQPKVDAHSHELVGLEALLRWKSPSLGNVGPSEFIPVAENCGLISTIGAWCLDEACRQIRAWDEAGLALVPVSVNVSSAQFSASNLQQVVSAALKRHTVEPRHLELELTESLLVDERHGVEEVLRDLRSIGIRIALDDFGTGYSALTYLNRFSLDVLKMDRGLLRNIDSDPSARGIANAVVSMAHSLGLKVVAEGVDVEDQIPLLRDMGCDHIQGFLFAPALPAEEVTRFICRRGEQPVRLVSGAPAPGKQSRQEATVASSDDEPALRVSSQSSHAEPRESASRRHSGRLLLVDDGGQSLATVAMRLMNLGIDVHYASASDEAQIFIAQEGKAIRSIGFAPSIPVALASGLRNSLVRMVGGPRSWMMIGERPDEEIRRSMRKAGVDWVLWAPFNDAELRYVVKSAMTLREDLAERREVRVPVDLVVSIQSGARREVAVISSISPSGAFVELTSPPACGSKLRLEFDLGGDFVRVFARVANVQQQDPARPGEPSGAGVSFYGLGRDEERLLRKAVGELQLRYVP